MEASHLKCRKRRLENHWEMNWLNSLFEMMETWSSNHLEMLNNEAWCNTPEAGHNSNHSSYTMSHFVQIIYNCEYRKIIQSKMINIIDTLCMNNFLSRATNLWCERHTIIDFFLLSHSRIYWWIGNWAAWILIILNGSHQTQQENIALTQLKVSCV